MTEFFRIKRFSKWILVIRAAKKLVNIPIWILSSLFPPLKIQNILYVYLFRFYWSLTIVLRFNCEIKFVLFQMSRGWVTPSCTAKTSTSPTNCKGRKYKFFFSLLIIDNYSITSKVRFVFQSITNNFMRCQFLTY